MLLTAPRLTLETNDPAAAPTEGPAEGGTGRELLALLRGTAAGAPNGRPRFDPGLAGGLRAWLEDAAYDVVARRGPDARPLVLGPRRLLGSDDERPAPGRCREHAGGADRQADTALVARLVHTLFRQLVHTGAVGTRWPTPLDALRASGALCPGARRGVAGGTRTRRTGRLPGPAGGQPRPHSCPGFAPGWMPRTDDHVAIPLAGGRVVLQGTFDLSGRHAPARHGVAVRARARRPAAPGHANAGRCTISPCSRRCAVARLRSVSPCSTRCPAATGSRTCARSTCAPWPRTSWPGSTTRVAGLTAVRRAVAAPARSPTRMPTAQSRRERGSAVVLMGLTA